MKGSVFLSSITVLLASFASAAEVPSKEAFGWFDSADAQTKYVACEKAIYEWDYYEQKNVWQTGNMSAADAETAYATAMEALKRQVFYHVLAQTIDLNAYALTEKKVNDIFYAEYDKDASNAQREYNRLGEFCLYTVYDRLMASSSEAQKADTAVRGIVILPSLRERAKAEFIKMATTRDAK